MVTSPPIASADRAASFDGNSHSVGTSVPPVSLRVGYRNLPPPGRPTWQTHLCAAMVWTRATSARWLPSYARDETRAASPSHSRSL
jgi:hypothetical protein